MEGNVGNSCLVGLLRCVSRFENGFPSDAGVASSRWPLSIARASWLLLLIHAGVVGHRFDVPRQNGGETLLRPSSPQTNREIGRVIVKRGEPNIDRRATSGAA